MYFLLKVLISALIVAAVSELGRRNAPLAAILASLPIVSILALGWLYWDTRSPPAVAELARQILWALLPSLLFFATLPYLLKSGMRFGLALPLAMTVMVAGYFVYLWILRFWGIRF